MGIAALLLSVLAFAQGGWGSLAEGFLISGKTLVRLTPLMLLAFATAGLISVLISKEMVSRWMGKEAGWKGLFLGALAGAFVPGGPYVYFPLAATFLASGAEIGTVMAFIVSKNVWTVSRLPMEVALLGPEITVIRYIVTFLFPILLGIATNVLFSRSTEKIRTQIRELHRSDESR